MSASGCRITGPCCDIACSIILRCSRCSASEWANALVAMSARRTVAIFRMLRERLPFSRFCLQLHDDVAAVQQIENAVPQSDETDRPQQRGHLLGKERLEAELIGRLVDRHRLAADVDLPVRINHPGHQSRSGERDQWVHAVDDEWLRPSRNVTHVNKPEAGCQNGTSG